MNKLITYANHGGKEQVAFFISNDGKHRINVRRAGTNQIVSISRCQIILNSEPDEPEPMDADTWERLSAEQLTYGEQRGDIQ